MGRGPDKTFWTSAVGKNFSASFEAVTDLPEDYFRKEQAIDPEIDGLMLEIFMRAKFDTRYVGHWQTILLYLVGALAETYERKKYKSRWRDEGLAVKVISILQKHPKITIGDLEAEILNDKDLQFGATAFHEQFRKFRRRIEADPRTSEESKLARLLKHRSAKPPKKKVLKKRARNTQQ